MYYLNGCLREASTLAKDHLLAAMGYGADHFNLRYGVTTSAPHLCLPINTFDALIYELKLQNEDNSNKPFKNVSLCLSNIVIIVIFSTEILTVFFNFLLGICRT